MNGNGKEPVGHVPCDVLETLMAHNVPCVAISQIPFECKRPKMQCEQVEPKEPVKKG
ncbi:MAG: hypothetical protein HYZ07_02790 [Candidatus Harrisonbacteria bacterium]|nr:hypothetical protein [Candidatus Harrisonbacteria bacterium]